MYLWGALWIANDLRYTITITYIQKNKAPMIATAIDPASQDYLLARIIYI